MTVLKATILNSRKEGNKSRLKIETSRCTVFIVLSISKIFMLQCFLANLKIKGDNSYRFDTENINKP